MAENHNHDLRYYRRAEIDYRFQPARLMAAIRSVDGPGSLLDADSVDGLHGSEIASQFHCHLMVISSAQVIPAGYCLALDHVEIEADGSLDVQGVLNL